jgi:hypothetical protein
MRQVNHQEKSFVKHYWLIQARNGPVFQQNVLFDALSLIGENPTLSDLNLFYTKVVASYCHEPMACVAPPPIAS